MNAQPVIDGGVRGAIFGILMALLVFANDKTEWLTDQDVITLTPVLVGLSFLVGGAYDAFVRPRIRAG